MVLKKSSRKYDILILGASGYTGTLTAQHIAAHLPTNLRWAISSTSRSKLESLAAKLKEEYSDRTQPHIEVINVNNTDKLGSVVEQAKVCISAVYYTAAGEQVIRACIESGTDYIDCSVMSSLLYTWTRKFHKQAQDSGVALIHACGDMITPLDLVCWLAVQEIQSRWSLKTGDVVLRMDGFETNMSGGTIRTILPHASLSPKVIKQVQSPSALSPIEHPGEPSPFWGMRRHPQLGLLAATFPTADQDRAIIYRTWGLLEGTEKSYGPNFEYNEYAKAPSVLGGILMILQSYILSFLLSLARIGPIRNYLFSIAPAAGSGPSAKVAESAQVSLEVFAKADPGISGAESTKSVRVSYLYPGGHYPLAGLNMAQAAASLLYSRKLGGNITGGCLTPAILGPDFIERTKSVGVQYTINAVDDD
ncbi:Saccharopine dehydrogenase-domain-containing protein [Hypoxylon trugodes]|uniref:Saccharopine dehydrogenase-domain-containing protein n=1 Tax=Hypoxylon trugodes TaxID=326681 RepID=UPI00219D07B6|nr:Saccharopine dehydrogenase-domain-containing protein [Hypoxylon trugodes]KAI1386969.1 Saccharopine dehydrogenase-domain-containing protein [Hypoxylon trugodes]